MREVREGLGREGEGEGEGDGGDERVGGGERCVGGGSALLGFLEVAAVEGGWVDSA